MCRTELPSRRNRVEQIKTAQGVVIRKTFSDAACMNTEAEVYRHLAGTPLPHADLLAAEADALVFHAIPGETFSALLERQERKNEFDPAPWTALADWIDTFCRLTGFALTDCNLRNFLFDADTRTVYGVDFEECCPGSAQDAIARLCAHILLHSPEETAYKRSLVAALCSFTSEAQIDAEIQALRTRRTSKHSRESEKEAEA